MSTTIFIGLGGPPPELSELGPGAGGGAGSAGMGSVLGRVLSIQTTTNASASLELRVVVHTPGSGENVNTELASGVDEWTAQDIWQALDRIKWIVRARGFTLGSGGPGTVAGTSSGAGTQTIPLPI